MIAHSAPESAELEIEIRIENLTAMKTVAGNKIRISCFYEFAVKS
jgi:hypothetical protein